MKDKRFIIDLLPLVPGGANGGAKYVALEIVWNLRSLAPDCTFFLLCSDRNHRELAFLESDNTRRINISAEPKKSLLERLGWKRKRGIVESLSADLMFCPFTGVSMPNREVPVVTVVHDLLYCYYPLFFESGDLAERERNFIKVCEVSEQIVCVSDFVRDTIKLKSEFPSHRVTRIHNRLSRNLEAPDPGAATLILHRLRLEENAFLFYPANFWPHKNHRMLLTAYGMFRARNPGVPLKLVWTGVPNPFMVELRDFTARFGLEEWVEFPGFLEEGELSVLYRTCRAVIFPSLFEGFGMPVLEAMATGAPVLCSDIGALREVAGGSALFFDPKKPLTMTETMERIMKEPELIPHLVAKGKKQARSFRDSRAMGEEYLTVFKKAMEGKGAMKPTLEGVFEDGWTGSNLKICYGREAFDRFLEIHFSLPESVPYRRLKGRVRKEGGFGSRTIAMERGKSLQFRQPLPHGKGRVEIFFGASFSPRYHAQNEDTRILACRCDRCRILSPSGEIELFPGGH